MTKKVLMTPENKRVVIDTEKDEKIYNAPVNPPNTGTRYTEGTDVYRHVARSGNEYFYFYTWSMWQGSESSYELATKEELENFLIKKAGLGYWESPDDEEIRRFEEIGINIYVEDA